MKAVNNNFSSVEAEPDTDDGTPAVKKIPLFSNIELLVVNLNNGRFQALIEERKWYEGELMLFETIESSDETIKITELHLVGLNCIWWG